MRTIVKTLSVLIVIFFQASATYAAMSDTKPIALVVEFTVVAGKQKELIAIMREHAKLTLQEEPETLRFEVLQPMDSNGAPILNKLMLVELYKNKRALTFHNQNPRLPSVLSKIKPLLIKQRITETTVLAAPSR